jgi:hypothetical protein
MHALTVGVSQRGVRVIERLRLALASDIAHQEIDEGSRSSYDQNRLIALVYRIEDAISEPLIGHII